MGEAVVQGCRASWARASAGLIAAAYGVMVQLPRVVHCGNVFCDEGTCEPD
jgi:hypothetical protein